VIRFGISGLPDTADDKSFLDELVNAGYEAYELAFVKGFPWNERRCSVFGELAAERGIELSVHAPYFAILTVDGDERSAQSLAAIENTMKLGRALGARIVCVHPGHVGDRSPHELMVMIRDRLERLEPKVQGLGVGLGLETSGSERNFGSLGDIAILASEYSFVRPIVDWAHIHAKTGGGLVTKEAFESVIEFVQTSFPAWMIDPLQCQFTDNLIGSAGEVRHLPYGEGTLRVGPLVEAALVKDFSMTLISEAREESSHQAIHAEAISVLERDHPERRGRTLSSGLHRFPGPVRVVGDGGRWRLDGDRPLSISNIDKEFFPEGTTKGDLVHYYASIAPIMLTHLQQRPISMARYPDGIEGNFFYEKRAPSHRPDWMESTAVGSESAGGEIEFLLASNRESLMWLASMGCIEVHPFHSRTGSLGCPDYAIFDLDPDDEARWEQVVATAKLLEIALDRLSLCGYPKLSGSRGIHIYVPLEPIYEFSRVRRFAYEMGKLLAAANPDDVTLEWDVSKRKGKVFVDHNRNASGQTVAAAYSVRPRPRAPVSAPIRWDELDQLRNGDITIDTIWDRLRRQGDLFSPVVEGGQRLEQAEEKLGLA